jgi:hypothetical protein
MLASFATVLLATGLALAPATSASAATGQLSVRNNCGVNLEYWVTGPAYSYKGNDYAYAGQVKYWSLRPGTYYVNSAKGSRTVYVAANRSLLVNLCR